MRKIACGLRDRFETAPLAGSPTVRPERDELLADAALLRACAAVKTPRELVVGVERGEHAYLVTAARELRGERLDVARDSPRVGPRVRREERDPHEFEL